MFLRPHKSVGKLSGTNRLRQILFAFSCLFAIFCYYEFFSFQSSQQNALSGEIITTNSQVYMTHQEGSLLAFLFDYFGSFTYLIPLIIIYVAYLVFNKSYSLKTIDLFKVGLFILGINSSVIGFCSLFSYLGSNSYSGYGGVLGDFLNLIFKNLFTSTFAPFISILIAFAGICLFFVKTPFGLFDCIGRFTAKIFHLSKEDSKGSVSESNVNSAVNNDNLGFTISNSNINPVHQEPRLDSATPGFSNANQEENLTSSSIFKDMANIDIGVDPHLTTVPNPAPQVQEAYENPISQNSAFNNEPVYKEEPVSHPSSSHTSFFDRTEPTFDPTKIAVDEARSINDDRPTTIITYQNKNNKTQQNPESKPKENTTIIMRGDKSNYALFGSATKTARREETNPTVTAPDEITTIIERGDNSKRDLFSNSFGNAKPTSTPAPVEPQAPAVDDGPTTIITHGNRQVVTNLQPTYKDNSVSDDMAYHESNQGGDFISREDNEQTVQNIISFNQEPQASINTFEVNSLPPAFIPRQNREESNNEIPAPAQAPLNKVVKRDPNALDRHTVLVSEKDLNYNYQSASRGVIPHDDNNEVQREQVAESNVAETGFVNRQINQNQAATAKVAATVNEQNYNNQEHSNATPVTNIATEPKVNNTNYPNYMVNSGATTHVNTMTTMPTKAFTKSMVSAPVKEFGQQRPSIELLTPSDDNIEIESSVFEDVARRIDAFMQNFGVKAKVARYLSGPVITRYDVELEPGVRSSTISSLSTDLCRDLMVATVRVIDVIPGTQYVGLEVPNPKRKLINLYNVVRQDEFTHSNARLPITLGVSVTGQPVVVDLVSAPHLLIAGTTGSGKSAGLNSMLVSLLLKRSPDEMRLILIDPKQLEFNLYENIPHLITPVITDVAEKTSAALRWCVEEMERRYKLIGASSVRKIDEYNELVDNAKARGEVLYDPTWTADMGGTPPVLRHLPYIVVVIEEYADLIAQTQGRKKNENSPESLIARLTQKARAAGIHVILATQTPRVDVVTSVIKANMPSRIAYTVQSLVDSRVILDEGGAEKLLGYGDMLSKFSGYNNNATFRAHGAFVSNDDVQRVVNAWKEIGGEPEYVDGVTDSPDSEQEDDSANNATMQLDKNFDQAAAYAREFYARKQKYPTVSDYQATFGLGWARAKKLVYQLKREGVVDD